MKREFAPRVDGEEDALATVDVLRSSDSEAEELTFADLPPLSCGARFGSAALPIEESESAEGQVLLLGGSADDGALDTLKRTKSPRTWRFWGATIPSGRLFRRCLVGPS
jgi:hypothetical protein